MGQIDFDRQQLSNRRLALGIRGIPLAWHIITALLMVPVLAPMLRLTMQEVRIIGWTLMPVGILGGMGATFFRERAVRVLSKFFDRIQHANLSDAEYSEAFALLVNLPRREAFIGIALWLGFGFPIMFALGWQSETFTTSTLIIFSMMCLSIGFTAVMFIFVSLKGFLTPWRTFAAQGISDSQERACLVRTISVGAKFKVAVGSLVCTLTFFAVSLSQTRVLTQVERLATSGHREVLKQAWDAVTQNGVDLLDFETSRPLGISLGDAHLLLVDRTTGKVVRGDASAIKPGEIHAFLEVGSDEGDSSIFNTDNEFSWTLLPDRQHFLMSAASGNGLGVDIATENAFAMLCTLVAVAMAIFVMHLQSRDVTRSLQSVKRQVALVAAGDLRGEGITESEDELGALGRGVGDMTHSLRETVSLVANAANCVEASAGEIARASQNVAHLAQVQGDSVRSVATSMDAITQHVQEIAESGYVLENSVQESSRNIEVMQQSRGTLVESSAVLHEKIEVSAQAFEKIYGSIARAVRGADQLADAAEGTTSGIQEIAAALRQVDKNAIETARLSDGVMRNAEVGRDKMQKTLRGIASIREDTNSVGEIVRTLSESTQEIDGIVNVITSVADETNLLALNAAIIAAQAGEHGRAFSVVAGEIKALAERVLLNTKEITSVIDAVQSRSKEAVDSIARASASVEQGVAFAEEAGAALDAITESAHRSSMHMQEVVAAVQEQSSAAQHVAGLMVKVEHAASEIDAASTEQDRQTNEVTESNRAMETAANEVGRATDEQAKSAQAIAQSVEKVKAATHGISNALQKQSQVTQDVAAQMDRVKASTQENQLSSTNMQESVESLLEEASKLREGVKQFKI